jgi:hypothetical protein
MNTSVPKTTEATKIKNEFASWYAGLSYMDRNWSTDDTFDRATVYRDSFNRANATTSQERAAVEHVIKTGTTLEDAAGQPPKARTASGERAVAAQPLVPTWQWVAFGAVAIGGLYALGKVTTLAQLFAGKKKQAMTSNPSRKRARR